MWASLEHKLRYKQKKELPEDLKLDLQKCAEEIAEMDTRLQNIHIDIQNLKPYYFNIEI
jgi:putative GTP pyrophosphokinase